MEMEKQGGRTWTVWGKYRRHWVSGTATKADWQASSHTNVIRSYVELGEWGGGEVGQRERGGGRLWFLPGGGGAERERGKVIVLAILGQVFRSTFPSESNTFHLHICVCNMYITRLSALHFCKARCIFVASRVSDWQTKTIGGEGGERERRSAGRMGGGGVSKYRISNVWRQDADSLWTRSFYQQLICSCSAACS